jgi:small-conductance mechanosensitive channel
VMELEVYRDDHRSRDLVLALVTAALAVGLLTFFPQLSTLAGRQNVTLMRALVLIFAGATGVLAVRLGTAAAFAGLEKRQAVVVWRNLLSWTLYILILVMLATAAGINVSAILFAGGVLSVVAAIAAQSTLSNLFAGLVLLIARPYRIGQSVYFRSGSFGGAQYEGLIVDIGSLYTTLSSDGLLFRIPNSVVIASVLVPNYKPVRADVAMQVPAAAPLRLIEDRIRSSLRLQPGARVFVEPEQYAMQDGVSQMTVRLRIRADEWLPAEDVMRAIDAAVREDSSAASSGASEAASGDSPGDAKPKLVDSTDSRPA